MSPGRLIKEGTAMVMAPVRFTMEWIAPLAETSSIHTALQGLIVLTRAEPGCIGCSLSTRMTERAGFSYEETWKTEEDLKRQLRSSRFARLMQLAERATERPSIQFELPGGTRGLDYAEEVGRVEPT